MLFEYSQILPSVIRVAAYFDVAIDALSNARERPPNEHSEVDASIAELKLEVGDSYAFGTH